MSPTARLPAIALAAAMLPVVPTPAIADECVVDTDDNGSADGTMGAISPDAMGATACGSNAKAQDYRATAIGSGSSALDSYATAIGNGATASRVDNEVPLNIENLPAETAALAIGAGAAAIGRDAVALGRGAVAARTWDTDAHDGTYSASYADYAIAIGGMSAASARFAMALGSEARASGIQSIALGNGALASATYSSALGIAAESHALGGLAFGTEAIVQSGSAHSMAIGTSALVGPAAPYAMALGHSSAASNEGAAAIGANTTASGFSSAAVGRNAYATEASTTAVGQGAGATGGRATAVGQQARATGGRSTAVGYDAEAGERSTAVGESTVASQFASLAVGFRANASRVRSTAVGANAATTADDQVMLGGAGSSVAVGDIDASTAAQTDTVYYATVDEHGTLGRSDQVVAGQALASLQSSMRAVAAVSDAQFAALEGRVDALSFELSELDQAVRGGIAAATALGSAISMPDKRFTIGGNIATHGGEQGYAASFTGRVSNNFAIGAGVAGNTGDDRVTAQVGFAFGF